jgi:hypothetical protein
LQTLADAWIDFLEYRMLYVLSDKYRSTSCCISYRIDVVYIWAGGSGSSVGIATVYGLDGPGIESWWVKIFRTCPDRSWSLPSLLYNRCRIFSEVKSGRGVTLTPHPLPVP